MNTLYDSESFAVVHIQPNAAEGAVFDIQHMSTGRPIAPGRATAPYMERHGFEIVDKRSGKEVYLDGSWAELFQRHISAWQLNTPSQEEVEDTLERYAELAQNPVVVH